MREWWWRTRYAAVWWWRWAHHGVFLSLNACLDAAWAGDCFDFEMTPAEAVDEELSYWTE